MLGATRTTRGSRGWDRGGASKGRSAEAARRGRQGCSRVGGQRHEGARQGRAGRGPRVFRGRRQGGPVTCRASGVPWTADQAWGLVVGAALVAVWLLSTKVDKIVADLQRKQLGLSQAPEDDAEDDAGVSDA